MMNMELGQREKILLEAFNIEGGYRELSIERLKGYLKMKNVPEEWALRYSHALQENGLLIIDEKELPDYHLTVEGKNYAENGLPEQRVFAILPDTGAKVDEMRQEAISKGILKNEVDISLGWMRKKKWVEFKDGQVIPIKGKVVDQDQELLQAIRDDRHAPMSYKESIPVLLKRGLLKMNVKKEILLTLTEKGISALKAMDVVQGEDELTLLTPEIINNRSYEGRRFIPYDVTIPALEVFPTKLHPYRKIINDVKKAFITMGFEEIKGEIVQSSFWNFDALFTPQDHPVREMQDTFYLETNGEVPDGFESVRDMHLDKWGGSWSEEVAQTQVLRTHTTTHSIQYLASHRSPPVKIFCIDRAYRRETVDATHTPEFEQIEGIVMDKGLSFS